MTTIGKKFDTCKPIQFRLNFRSTDARRTATLLGTLATLVSAEALSSEPDGFGTVQVVIQATTGGSASRRLERALEGLGRWEDRSGGAYGDDAVLIFVLNP